MAEVRFDSLRARLERGLAPLYLVAGDEPLLVQEACEAIRETARAHGYTERSVHFVEPGYRWDALHHDTSSMSLFAERRLIEVRMSNNRFQGDGAETLKAIAAAPPEDVCVLVRCARLDARQKKSAWYRALVGAGDVVHVWPVGPRDMPRWLDQRLQAAGLRLAPTATAHLIERVEGNLLAAVQEIEKLRLADLPQPIDAEALDASVQDAAHFETFPMLDAVYAGDAARASRMLRGLRQEGVALFAIAGALVSQLRRATTGGRGGPSRLAQRIGAVGLAHAIAECALIDQQGKGLLVGDAWASLENLLIRLAGNPAVPLPSEQESWVRRPF